MSDRNLYKKVDFKENFKTYLGFAKPYRWLLVIIIILATTLELFNIVEKYLFKIILDKGGEFIAGVIGRPELIQVFLMVAGVFAGLLVLKVINHWFRIGLLNKVEAGMMFDLKKKYFDHIITLDHGFHTTHKTGSMITRLNRGTAALERMTDFIIFNVAPLFLQIAIIGSSLIFIEWASALSIVITALVFVVYGLYISKIQKEAHVKSNQAEDREKGYVADVFTNIDSIKYFGKENFIKDRFGDISEETKKKRLAFWQYGRYFGSGESLILGIGTFFIIYFPLMSFLNGGISVGTLAFIYTVYGGLMGPLFGFVHGIRGFYISLGDFDELFEYGKIKNEVIDDENAKEIEIKKGEIEFNKVSFIYKNRNERAVRNLSLKIKQNEKVALVGHSGCGKTTLTKLLYRFYDPMSGNIFIDGVNLKNIKQESLRGELSIVPQECILFDDTIYNNISFSNPKAKKEEVIRAIKFAQLDKFIAGLPDKEKTIVGERGVKLSGGEKQRVSIARAILANKKILVLDEATSALDSKTEHEIQSALQNLMKGRTTIIIAHRLSTIMSADRIIVMSKGEIVQSGRHSELIKQKGIYNELWNFQKGGYLGE